MTKPNIVFIITDHHAWYGHYIQPDGSSGGIAPEPLPVWEQFCKDGAVFRNAYSICPLCTPARSSMMSGLKPQHHGRIHNGGDFDNGIQLLNHVLTDNGYQCDYIGKWHCGKDKLSEDYGMPGWSLPEYGKVYMSDTYKAFCKEHNFDEAKAYIEQNLDRPEWIGETLTLHHESPWYFMNGSGVFQSPRAAHESDFVEHMATKQLHKLTQQDKPFSLVASWWAPHQPYYPSEPFAGRINPKDIPEHPSYRDDLSDKPSRHMIHRECHHAGAKALEDWETWQPVVARCYEQCLQTDAAIGNFLQELEHSGEADNTIVVWCADHGDSLAGHGGLWDKAATMTEEVMRIPMAIRWPKHIKPGTEIHDFVSNLDCPASILDAAGCAVPEHWDSKSVLPIIRGEESRDEIVCEHHGHCTILEQRMLRWGNWKYVTALYDGDELYDLETDPWELENRIDDPSLDEIKQQCREKILKVLEQERDTNISKRLKAVLKQQLNVGTLTAR